MRTLNSTLADATRRVLEEVAKLQVLAQAIVDTAASAAPAAQPEQDAPSVRELTQRIEAMQIAIRQEFRSIDIGLSIASHKGYVLATLYRAWLKLGGR